MSYLIERQGCEVIVVYTDIKLCREEVLKASGVNPGVRWTGMNVSEELPHVIMIATIKAQIREVIQIDFLLPDLNAHRHCNVLKPVYESLPDILEWKNRSRLGQCAGADWDTFDAAKLMIFSETVAF